MNQDSKILLVGHNDIIENALYKHFSDSGFQHVFSTSKLGLDATIQASVYDFFQTHRPEYIFLGSTLSGGITANVESPADFIYNNIQSSSNIFYAAQKFKAKKILFYASSCVYPRNCPQPMAEDQILMGPFEETSESYSVAKLAGIRMAKSFRKQYGLNAIVMIPATVYGPGFDADLKTSHVIGAQIHKCIQAVESKTSEITVWGTGEPRREFLYVDDLVEASLFLMENYNDSDVVNAGCGSDVSITELTQLVADAMGFKADLKYDTSKPDGAPRKLLDNTRIKKLGWSPKIELADGIARTIEWYKRKVEL